MHLGKGNNLETLELTNTKEQETKKAVLTLLTRRKDVTKKPEIIRSSYYNKKTLRWRLEKLWVTDCPRKENDWVVPGRSLRNTPKMFEK